MSHVNTKNPFRKFEVMLAFAVLLNIGFWLSVRGEQAKWGNVPPAPPQSSAASSGLGDYGLAYRSIGLMLQNLGDTGGRVTSLQDYDYNMLTSWFFIQHHLDPRSDYTPYLAAYYYSATQAPKAYYPVLDYLEKAGLSTQGEKWRFLAHAVYLARFVIEDQERALALANKLAAHPKTDLPAWTRQMPAFVLTQQGDKKAAYALLLEILKSSAETLHPNEITNMRYYICDRVITRQEAEFDPLCKDLP